MAFYCIESFKSAFCRLISKKNYRELEKDFINKILSKSISELRSGSLLNQYTDVPYIKARLNGSGGYRMYYLLLIKKDNIYFAFIHPKTGPFGSPNLEQKAIGELYDEIVESIKKDSYYEISHENSKVKFAIYEPAKELVVDNSTKNK